MLADHQIRDKIENTGDVLVYPYDPSLIQPASLDMRLGSDFIKYGVSTEPIDPEAPDESKLHRFNANRFVIYPGDFVLGTTIERIGVSSGISARVEGKSTLGRLGLIIHSTAGFIDPGFKGNITLEMTNINTRPIVLRAGMKVCQISFYEMDEPSEVPYGHEKLGSHYQNQAGVTPAAALMSNFSW
ncbi:MAG TPA: dCTP deaminase [Candidatus Paceibacterota bacterium]